MHDRKLLPLIAALSSTAYLAACGDDGGDTTPDDSDAGSDVESDGSSTTDVGTDAAIDAATDAVDDGSGAADTGDDTAEDVEDDAPLPNCDEDEGERLVGRICRDEFDRACLVDTDCRETEECIFTDEKPVGTCIFTPAPARACPGSEGCTDTDGPLRAAFARRTITPPGWEFPRPGYSERPDAYGTNQDFLGDVSDPDTFCDCGRDMRCPPTTEFDDCFTLGDYTGPDADGTEGDGFMQGAWLAGFGSSRQAGLCPPELLGPDCDSDACCVHQRAHDDLWARGFVLEKGDLRVAVVTIDTVGFFYNDIERAEDLLDPSLGIDQLVVSSTHTHEAPDTMGRWGAGSFGSDLPSDSGVVPEWQAEIRQAIADVVTEAASNLVEVDAYATQTNTGSFGFAGRDSRDPFVFNDLITAVHFVRAGTDRTDSANTVGTMLNWHSHPEALGGDNPYMTSDFVHYYRDAIENGFAEEAVGEAERVFPAWDGFGGTAVYISGSVGGLITPLGRPAVSRTGEYFEEDGWQKARALGERLADATFEAFKDDCAPNEGEDRFGCAAKLDLSSLSFAEADFFLDIESVQIQAAAISLHLFDREIYNWRALDGTRAGTYPKVLSNVTQIRLGELSFQTFPGEVFSEVVLGGYTYDNVLANVIVGSPYRLQCDEDGVGAYVGDGEGYPCIVRPDNPNPPDLSRAPAGPYVRERIGTEFNVIVGLGNDELGYLIPPYDFKVDPNLGALVEVEGDHYEETVSPGEFAVDVINEQIDILNGLLDP